MAEKLQSKVKLRSGEVVTIDHVKPSKTTTNTTKSTKTPTQKTTEPVQNEPETTTPPNGPTVADDKNKNSNSDENKSDQSSKTNKPKETK